MKLRKRIFRVILKHSKMVFSGLNEQTLIIYFKKHTMK